MNVLTIRNNVTGLGGDDVVRSCGCALCASAGAAGQAAPHMLQDGVAVAADGARGAVMLDQYKGQDGFYHYSGDRNIDAVLIGSKWTGTALTYSFPTSGESYGGDYDFGQASRHVVFNDAQQAAARAAFGLVSGYTKLTFTEVAPDGAERPTFRLSSTASGNVGSAMGYFPHTYGDLGGDIWFGRTAQPYYEDPAKGNWGYITILHEIGHTLGLKHGHSDYTDEDLGSFFGLDAPFAGSRALEYNRDGQAWSIMTYTTSPDAVNGFNGDGQNQAQSYMMYDIAALQYMYGANYTTNAGDTVYRWNDRTGEMSINGIGQGAPAGNKVLETIWDGGGNDTYDLSNYDGDLSIDLRPGALSTISAAQLADAQAYYDDGDAPMAGNIGNALLYRGDTASLIENAVGGSGNDRIAGNDAGNRLDGGAGNDLLTGGRGSDLLIGGAGNDVADFGDAATGISITFNNGAADIIVANGDDRDVLRGVEGAIGTAFNDTLVGDRAANMLSGGTGGQDYLNGGDGDDTLVGATDTIVHADRPDLVETGDDWGNHDLQTAVSLDGSFDLSSSAIVEMATVLPHATVRATGPGGGTDVYSFTATAGSRTIIDLDGVAPDSTAIQLVDALGNVVASNFGIARTDGGSRSGGTPMLDHVFQASGTYYVRVGGIYYDWSTNTPVPGLGGLPGATDYVLNVSVENARVDSTVTAIGAGRFYGGAGNDLILASTGADLISGGAGTDTLSYANARAGVQVDLSITRAQATGGSGSDTIAGIENLTGSTSADVLRGDAGNNVIQGGGGDDLIAGGAGTDTLSFAGLNRQVIFSLAAQGTAQNAQAGSIVTATGFENLTGGRGGDILSGDRAANVIDGGAGDDVLIGAADGSVGGIDTLKGGDGVDTASFAAMTAGVIVTMQGGGTGRAQAGTGATLADLSGIEAVEGGFGDDRLYGSADADTLSGRDGADELAGGGGDDALDGGFGDDRIVGGDGIDTAVFASGSFHVVDLAQDGVQSTGEGNDVLTGIENLRGGTGTDLLFGSAGDNVFYDIGGDDIYDGRDGSDTVDYSTATGLLSVDLTLDYQQDTLAAGQDLIANVENVVGGDAGNILTGTAAANRLTGGTSTDVLVGGTGGDRLAGGDGDDLLIGDELLPLSAPGGAMDDVLIGGRGADRLIGGEGDDLLSGGSGNDVLIGGGAIVNRYGNNFALDGLVLMDGGQDTLDGGDGDDYGVLFYAGRPEAIYLDNRNVQATNAVLFDGVAHGSVTSVETLRFYGGDNADHVETGAGYDSLQGGAGDDHLSAGAGDDAVNGGAGNDWLDGGIGSDTVSYATAAAGITLDLRIAVAQDTGGSGVDTVIGFENATLSAFDDVVHGTDAANLIRDASGGDDRIYGLGGDDILGAARTYGQPEDTVFIDGGTGNDLVEYLSIPTYNRFVPPRFYRQTDTVTLIGGEGDDRIVMVGQKTGTIDAGAGDDTVVIGMGGLNASTLAMTLGSGNDTVFIGYTDNFLGEIDRSNIIRDFQAGENGDRVDLTQVLLGWWNGDNPFAIDQMALVQDGDDVLLRVDMDRSGDYFQWRTFLTFENTQAADFTAFNFYRTDGDGVFTPLVETHWDPHAQVAGDSAVTDAALALAAATPAPTLVDIFAQDPLDLLVMQGTTSSVTDADRDVPAPSADDAGTPDAAPAWMAAFPDPASPDLFVSASHAVSEAYGMLGFHEVMQAQLQIA